MAHILLVENDESLRHFLVQVLVRAGHQVTECENGRIACEKFVPGKFSLLVTDIVMPELNGIELVKCIAGRDSEVKVIFITGFAAVFLQTATGAPKESKILSKPFHLREIVSEVDRILQP